MQVLYGTPLPPGLVAPTQGELRLRVDQLLLDNDAINHSPLIQLFETDAVLSSATRTYPGGAATDGVEFSSSAPPAPALSPNRFVVPVDYCAVGPIFWGETRPTAQGQPSTPQVRRGPLTMAYPIKIEPKQFRAYLQRMSASPQGGVQLVVFVPSSYSGRPPVTVGRARLALDHLAPGHPIQGWYPVLHRRSRSAAEAFEEGAAAALATSGSNAGAPLKEMLVGKIKVTVSMEYYPTTRHTKHPQHGDGVQSAVHQHSVKHRRQVEVGGGGATGILPQAKTRRSARHSGRIGTENADFSATSSASASFSSDVDVGVYPIAVRDSYRLRVRRKSPSSSALKHDVPTATQMLLEQGLRLRAQMDAAARRVDVDEASPYFSQEPGALWNSAEHEETKDVAAVVPVDSTGNDLAAEDHIDQSDSMYTSEASDEENFALQLQKDSEARDSRTTQQQQLAVSTPQKRHALTLPQQRQQYSQIERTSFASAHGDAAGNAAASVELCFSHFTFAQTPATADLYQLRLSVRLSSDITTSEPAPGPLSSYVHPVPFQQPSICLHFDVCSYSEDRSRLVVEAYKVIEETEVVGEADALGMRGPRQVAREELLGLSVLGLYRQSREVVFRDPVLDNSNVFALLEIRIQPASAIDIDGTQVGAALSPSQTPASIADSSVPLLALQQPKSTTKLPSSHGTVQHSAIDVGDTSRLLQPAAGTQQTTDASPATTTLQVDHSRLPISERRRLRVVVHSAAELPHVALAQLDGRRSTRYPLVCSSPRVLPDAGIASAQSYTEPCSFVTIEEIFQCAPSSPLKQQLQRDAFAKSRAHMQPMPNWYVVEAFSGYYDRSAVAERSSNPPYNYEVVLQLPEVVVKQPSVDDRSLSAARSVSANERAHPRGTVDMLEELQLNVWHSYLLQQDAAPTVVGHTHREKAHQQEEDFWSSAAYMGTCRIDLRPLRYLEMINGYYRAVCEHTPCNATDQSDADPEVNTIGYLRVSVSLV
ncbi:hypothetical protein ABL78_7076 [Leptomonas seymouri]|uniref:C2CD3 N-terminal C2 domain-containing protein n=1 Tax=Leptomonas seymouri TaxID=5684 RepID=A0A0N1I020_LEPSE|nr:hypothetical protein ABL78_7076 [Leptomonas seymouri]|eukprot:KPI83878.1 hypothetical protein ABL78_7076 [Leptomonas seymouri]